MGRLTVKLPVPALPPMVTTPESVGLPGAPRYSLPLTIRLEGPEEEFSQASQAPPSAWFCAQPCPQNSISERPLPEAAVGVSGARLSTREAQETGAARSRLFHPGAMPLKSTLVQAAMAVSLPVPSSQLALRRQGEGP